jgi:plastocyanin
MTFAIPHGPRAAAAVLLTMFASAGLVGCDAAEEPADTGSSYVTMYDNAFSPPVIHVPVGSRVTWFNAGRNPHNAIADDWSWSTEKDYGNIAMPAGASASVPFPEQGVFPYFCNFHGAPGIGMIGVVVVGDAVYEPSAARGLEPVSEPTGVTRRVPQEYPTIQAGVDAASPGDLVLVDRGVYREEVMVTTPSLVIRGVDRNEVVIDGEFLRGNGVLVLSDGVAVENLTARNAVLNGFFWTGVTGYRGSYLTAYNNGDYGIYAFDSVDGLFEHSYGSGSPDAGFYIGQCDPCNAVIRHVIAENNALGYSGTNSGGDLYIVSSIWRDNMAGIVPNTLDSELLPPQRESTLVANLVIGNNNRAAPAKPLQFPSLGNGIMLAGGVRNVVERNVVVGHEGHGIYVTPNTDDNFWPATDNVVRGNRVRGSGRADLAVGGPASSGNCFEDNDYRSSAPPGLQWVHGCDGLRLPLGYALLPSFAMLLRVRHARSDAYLRVDYRTQPVPPPQPQMPGGVSAPVRPAFEVFANLDFDVRRAELPPEAAPFLEGEIAEADLPSGARVDEPGWGGALLWRWSYYLPGLALLAGAGFAVRGRPGRGVVVFLIGLAVTFVVVALGAWNLAGVPW